MQAGLFPKTCKLRAPWPRKVLFIAVPFLPRVGGVESVVRSMADEFAARGHNVTVMTAEPMVGPSDSRSALFASRVPCKCGASLLVATRLFNLEMAYVWAGPCC